MFFREGHGLVNVHKTKSGIVRRFHVRTFERGVTRLSMPARSVPTWRTVMPMLGKTSRIKGTNRRRVARWKSLHHRPLTRKQRGEIAAMPERSDHGRFGTLEAAIFRSATESVDCRNACRCTLYFSPRSTTSFLRGRKGKSGGANKFGDDGAVDAATVRFTAVNRFV